MQEAVEEKKIAFEEKKQAVALAVSKAQQKRQQKNGDCQQRSENS